MIIFVTVFCLTCMIRTNSFILQDSYNILLKDSVNYKIDETIQESDYETIQIDQLAPFNIDDKENRFYELNKLASKEYDKTLISPINWFKEILTTISIVNSDKTTTVIPLTKHVHKRDTQADDTQYDYDDLFEEYYAESIDEAESNANDTYRAKKPGSSETGLLQALKQIVTNKSTEDTNSRLQAFKSFLSDCKDLRQSPKNLIARLWKTTRIWVYVYLAIAVPLWCTKGWGSCCLPCKFFKPQRTIEEAKIYSMLNPPGVLIINNKITHYEPTAYEKDCYDKFQHILRTL